MLDSTKMRITELSVRLEEVQSKIEKINAEKIQFIKDVDAANKIKAKIERKSSSIVYDAERKRALLKESKQRTDYLEKRVPLLKLERDSLSEKIVTSKSNLGQLIW